MSHKTEKDQINSSNFQVIDIGYEDSAPDQKEIAKEEAALDSLKFQLDADVQFKEDLAKRLLDTANLEKKFQTKIRSYEERSKQQIKGVLETIARSLDIDLPPANLNSLTSEDIEACLDLIKMGQYQKMDANESLGRQQREQLEKLSSLLNKAQAQSAASAKTNEQYKRGLLRARDYIKKLSERESKSQKVSIELAKRYKQSYSEIKGLQEQVFEFGREKEALEKRVVELETIEAQLHRQVERSAVLKNKLESVQGERAQLKEQVQSKETDLRKLISEREILRRKLKKVEFEVAEHEDSKSRIDVLRGELAVYTQELEDERKMAMDLNDQLLATQAEELRLRQSLKALEEAIAEDELDVESPREKIALVIRQKNQFRDDLTSQAEVNEDLLEQIQRLDQERGLLTTHISEIERLSEQREEQVEKLKLELAEEKGRSVVANSEKGIAATLLEAEKRNTDKAERIAREREAQLTKERAAKDELQIRIQELKTTLSDKEHKILSLTKEIELLNNTLDAASNSKKSLQDKLNLAIGSIEEHKERSMALQIEINDLRHQLNHVRDLSGEGERLQVEIHSLNDQLKKERQEYQSQRQELLRKLEFSNASSGERERIQQDLNTKAEKYRLQAEGLKEEIVALRSQKEEELSELKRELQAGNAKFRDQISFKETTIRQQAEEISRLSQFQKKSEILEIDVIKLNREISDLQPILKQEEASRLKIKQLNEKVAAMTEYNGHLKDEIKELKQAVSDKENLFVKIGAEQERLQNLAAEIEASESEVEAARVQVREMEESFYQEQTSHQKKKEECESLLRVNGELREEMALKATEIHALRELVVSLKEEKSQTQNETKKLTMLRGKVRELEESYERARDKFDELSLTHQNLENEYQTSEAKIKEADESIAKYRSDYSKLISEREYLKRRVEELEKRVVFDESKEVEAQALMEHAEQRAKALDQYSRDLDRDKKSLTTKVDKFIVELKGMSKISPLRDYLAITKKEITKIETFLNRLPAFSPERERYQEQLEHLVNQRETIAKLVEENEREISSKIQDLRTIANQDVLVPYPPLPPS